MTTIKITNSNDPRNWYADRIGDLFEADEMFGNFIIASLSKDLPRRPLMVFKSDCIVIDPAPAPEANTQPTQAINHDSQVLDRMRKEYERGRAANSPFPRYHGTFEHFIEECLKDYMQFAWN